MKFHVFVKNKKRSGNYAFMFEVHFHKDIEALRYALDIFDFKKHEAIKVFKHGKLLMKFER